MTDNNAISECAFNNSTKKGNLCSGNEGILYMKQMIKKYNNHINVENSKNIFDEAKLLTKCDSESCVISDKKFEEVAGNNKVYNIKKKFKPFGPRNNKEWLSNFNIDQVLNQWKDNYPGFVHIPFQMIDFARQKTKLETIDLVKECKNGMKSFATVINTDYSKGPGIHWFCIYGDFSNNNNIIIEYFNSSGTMPLNEIHEWLVKTIKKLNDAHLNARYEIVTRNEIQKSSSECGVFSLYYIYARLNNIPYTKFSELGLLNDEDMYEFRKYLFRRYE